MDRAAPIQVPAQYLSVGKQETESQDGAQPLGAQHPDLRPGQVQSAGSPPLSPEAPTWGGTRSASGN